MTNVVRETLLNVHMHTVRKELTSGGLFELQMSEDNQQPDTGWWEIDQECGKHISNKYINACVSHSQSRI